MKEVDPTEQLDDDVEDLLLHIADDFIEQTVAQAANVAKHRKANAIQVQDIQLVLRKLAKKDNIGMKQQSLMTENFFSLFVAIFSKL